MVKKFLAIKQEWMKEFRERYLEILVSLPKDFYGKDVVGDKVNKFLI